MQRNLMPSNWLRQRRLRLHWVGGASTYTSTHYRRGELLLTTSVLVGGNAEASPIVAAGIHCISLVAPKRALHFVNAHTLREKLMFAFRIASVMASLLGPCRQQLYIFTKKVCLRLRHAVSHTCRTRLNRAASTKCVVYNTACCTQCISRLFCAATQHICISIDFVTSGNWACKNFLLNRLFCV